jgi:hypothetical protein
MGLFCIAGSRSIFSWDRFEEHWVRFQRFIEKDIVTMFSFLGFFVSSELVGSSPASSSVVLGIHSCFNSFHLSGGYILCIYVLLSLTKPIWSFCKS